MMEMRSIACRIFASMAILVGLWLVVLEIGGASFGISAPFYSTQDHSITDFLLSCWPKFSLWADVVVGVIVIIYGVRALITASPGCKTLQRAAIVLGALLVIKTAVLIGGICYREFGWRDGVEVFTNVWEEDIPILLFLAAWVSGKAICKIVRPKQSSF